MPPPETLAVGAIRCDCLRGWWLTCDFNWWIGLVFVVGALLFIFGSVCTLWPKLPIAGVANPASLFFVGSVPFTVAASLQFYQAGNASEFPQGDTASVQRKTFQHKLFGCCPSELGWWSCLLQLLGTLLFNLSTYQAMNPGPNWISEDIWVWLPNFFGSVLFLLSGYMAFAETCHAYWRCLPQNLSWWAVFWNLAGCIGFMISAFLAVLVSNADPVTQLQFSTWFTLLGAVSFLLGSMLLMPEAATVQQKNPPSPNVNQSRHPRCTDGSVG